MHHLTQAHARDPANLITTTDPRETANGQSANFTRGRTRAPIYAPTPQRPYFHQKAGTPLSYNEVIIDCDHEQVAVVRELLAASICDLIAAGFAAADRGEHAEAVRQIAGAERLCGEARGLWPSSARRAHA